MSVQGNKMNFENHLTAWEQPDGRVAVIFVPNLWRLADNLPVRQVLISDFQSTIDYCIQTLTPDDIDRIGSADLNYPIILDPQFRVMDGVHRLVKARNRGDTFIQAKQLYSPPIPDLFYNSWDEYDNA